MDNRQNYTNSSTPRESLLMFLLTKVIKEYKALLELARRDNPLKIAEIVHLSSVPGETKFIIQVTNKNCIALLSAAEIINENYNLNDFSHFHGEMIRQAAQGKLLGFLKLSEKEPAYKIISKQYNAKIQQHIFTIETKENIRFNSTAGELSQNKDILTNIGKLDVYDIGYTQGSESVLREKTALFLAKERL